MMDGILGPDFAVFLKWAILIYVATYIIDVVASILGE
jgi:hypothetical protein